MGEDLSQGTKVAVILILLCAIIAIVFSIFSIMKNITNSSTQDLQTTLSSVSKQKFDDYDQRTVPGAQIGAACKLFADQPISLVVFTNRNSSGCYTYGLKGVISTVTVTTGGDGSLDTNKIKEVPGTSTKSVSYSGGVLSVPNGSGIAELPATFEYQNSRVDMNDTSKNAFVSSTSKFKSYLIKNKSGDVVGIMFDEIS